DLAGRLGHAPTAPPRPLAAMPRRCQQGPVWHAPTLHGRGGDRPPAFRHESFDRPLAQGLGDIPPHPQEAESLRTMDVLATDRQRRSPSLGTGDEWEIL